MLIIAGENSGEKYGASLLREFKKIQPQISFFGIGGNQMASEGAELLFSIRDLAVIGLFEVISHLPRIKRIFRKVRKEVRRRKPLAAVLIDSPDFNLRMAKVLKKQGIPVLYYISPTVWAWRKNRLKIIQKTVSKMMLIFPFEESIYRDHNIPASYVGHPLLERIKVTLPRNEFFKKYALDSQKKIISLLPGSRQGELKYHMPVLAKAIEKIKKEFAAEFILPLAENIDRDFLSNFIPRNSKDISILEDDLYEAIAYSDLVLSSCGTANLEAALLETPFVAFYRLSPISYRLGLRFIKIRDYSIVNILAGKRIVPELIQDEFNSNELFREARKLLTSETRREEMKEQFKAIKKTLGQKKASQNVAQELNVLLMGKNKIQPVV